MPVVFGLLKMSFRVPKKVSYHFRKGDKTLIQVLLYLINRTILFKKYRFCKPILFENNDGKVMSIHKPQRATQLLVKMVPKDLHI